MDSGRYMNILGKRLYVETYGERTGSPVLFFHGGPGAGIRESQAMLEAMGERYFVTAYDQMGCGRSGRLDMDAPFGMKEHLAQAEELRRVIGVREWTVMGHSYGGMLAAAYADAYPESTAAVIYDAPVWDFIDTVRGIASYYRKRVFVPEGSSEGCAMADRMIAKDYSGREPEIVYDILRLQEMTGDLSVRMFLENMDAGEFLKNANRGMSEAQIEEEASASLMHFCKLAEDGEIFEDHRKLVMTNKQPSIMIVGMEDPCVTASQRDYYGEYSFAGRTIAIPGCGHYPHIERLPEFIRAATDFMTSAGK